MITNVIADDNVYLQSFEPKDIKEKNLDITKLRILLNELGFNPVASGTQYIIDALEYFFNNNITEIINLKEVYIIPAEKHKKTIQQIQWDIESAIEIMNKYAPKALLQEIFYWYDSYKRITPRFFIFTMNNYLQKHYKEYQQ